MSHSGVTSQAGFPTGRGPWLAAAIAVSVVGAAIVIVRGPYGGPISGFGALLRTLGLLLLALIPLAALAWAWRRIPRQARRLAPIPVGVLSVMLLLLAFAWNNIYGERVRLGRDPGRMAAQAFERGDHRLWAVPDSTGSLVAPPVLNRCVVNRYDTRAMHGTEGPLSRGAHQRFARRAAEHARRYNEALLTRLRVPFEEARRPSDACPE